MNNREKILFFSILFFLMALLGTSFYFFVNMFSEDRFEREFSEYLASQKEVKTLNELVSDEIKPYFYLLKKYFPEKYPEWKKLILEKQIPLEVSSEVEMLGLFVFPCSNRGQAEILLSPTLMNYDADYITAVLYHEINHAEDIYKMEAPEKICSCLTSYEFDAEKKTLLFLYRINYSENHPDNVIPNFIDEAGNFSDEKLYELIVFRYPENVCYDNLANKYKKTAIH